MSSGDFDEIAFVRLLAACERNVFGRAVISVDGLGGKRPPVVPFAPEYLHSLTTYLDVLSNGIRTLEARHSTHEAPSFRANRARSDQLHEFRQRIEYLLEAKHVRSSDLDMLARSEQERLRAEAEAAANMIKRTVSAPAVRRKRTNSGSSASGMAKQSSFHQIPEVDEPQPASPGRRRAESFPSKAASETAASGSSSSAGKAKPVEMDGPEQATAVIKDPVELERRIHAKMQRQLAAMSVQLKEKANKVLDTLKAENKALDKTAGQIETNVTKITSANAQLADSLKASTGSCWTTLFMLLGVVVLFVCTFLLIQVKGKVALT